MTIIELKDRAARFHKSSIAFRGKAVLQWKNKQKSAAVTQSVNTTDLEITSVLPNCFYYQANFKLINFLQFP